MSFDDGADGNAVDDVVEVADEDADDDLADDGVDAAGDGVVEVDAGLWVVGTVCDLDAIERDDGRGASVVDGRTLKEAGAAGVDAEGIAMVVVRAAAVVEPVFVRGKPGRTLGRVTMTPGRVRGGRLVGTEDVVTPDELGGNVAAIVEGVEAGRVATGTGRVVDVVKSIVGLDARDMVTVDAGGVVVSEDELGGT